MPDYAWLPDDPYVPLSVDGGNAVSPAVGLERLRERADRVQVARTRAIPLEELETFLSAARHALRKRLPAGLLPRYLAGRNDGPLFLSNLAPVPSRQPAAADAQPAFLIYHLSRRLIRSALSADSWPACQLNVGYTGGRTFSSSADAVVVSAVGNVAGGLASRWPRRSPSLDSRLRTAPSDDGGGIGTVVP